MTPAEVLNMVKENGAKVVDLRFMDYPGLWQHLTVPMGELDESSFEDGFGFDGSSIRGWQPIHASDMLVIPDPTTAKMDPFFEVPTLVVVGNIVDPITRESYTRDPRFIAQKAEAYLKSTGIGDTAFIGPEAEFFIFDEIRFESSRHRAFYEIDSIEGIWNTGRDEGPNLGYKPRHKQGYFPVPPMDKFQDLRTEMLLVLEELGIAVECQHHEVATGGQAEIAQLAALVQGQGPQKPGDRQVAHRQRVVPRGRGLLVGQVPRLRIVRKAPDRLAQGRASAVGTIQRQRGSHRQGGRGTEPRAARHARFPIKSLLFRHLVITKSPSMLA